MCKTILNCLQLQSFDKRVGVEDVKDAPVKDKKKVQEVFLSRVEEGKKKMSVPLT